MSPHDQRPSGAFQRLARWFADTVAECNYAQRRLYALRTSPDNYLMASAGAPDTYSEFLFRTSGLQPHEPSARQRVAGSRPVT